MQSLKILTLGQAEVLVDGHPVQWRSDAARTLFFYLLSYPDGKSREEIIEMLWNTEPDAVSGNYFRVVIYRLRAALGWRDAITEEHSYYHLAQEVFEASDTHEFYRAFGQAEHAATPEVRLKRYRRVLAVYAGEYLPHESADWVLEVRGQHRTAAVRAEIEISLLHRQNGACEASVGALARALRLDPFIGENHHQKLMSCLSVVEDKYAAIEHYRRFLAFLRDELGDVPMRETSDLAARIKEGAQICLHAPHRPDAPETLNCPFTPDFRCHSLPTLEHRVVS
jgi:two-component SAPR family response regulator